jgi:MFS family permease
LLVLTLRGTYRPTRAVAATSVRRDIADGVRWLVRHRFLRSLTALSTVTGVFQSMGNGVVVLYVLEELRLPAGDFGVVLLVAGVGGLAGGLGTPPLARRFGRGPMLVSGAVVAAVATIGMGLTRNGFVGATLFALAASGVMVWNVLTMSLRQSLIPHHLFGRVQGAYRTLVWGAIPVGALLGGVLADHIGIRPVFVVAGIGLLASSCWLAELTVRHRDVLADPAVTAAESPLPTTVS